MLGVWVEKLARRALERGGRARPPGWCAGVRRRYGPLPPGAAALLTAAPPAPARCPPRARGPDVTGWFNLSRCHWLAAGA